MILDDWNAERYAAELPDRLLRDLANAPRDLTELERHALMYLSVGLTCSMAATLAGVSYSTMRKRLDRAVLILGAKNQTHAVALAIRQEII